MMKSIFNQNTLREVYKVPVRHLSKGQKNTPRKKKAMPHLSVTSTITIDKEMPLVFGGKLPKLDINYAVYNHKATHLPVVYIMPSMSHSAHVLRDTSPEDLKEENKEGDNTPTPIGWWEEVVGYGSKFGIDLNKFRVISASPLGGPYGSSSPCSLNPETPGELYRSHFPQITPADQARAHATLLDYLGIHKVHAVVGASMGGMQALEFAAQFPDRYDRFVSICSTGRTSPSTVALRSIQRSVVESDPNYLDGYYLQPYNGPFMGLGLARKIGTICYRSREEFDKRFEWAADENHSFEVERYLSHQASTFRERYDANSYLLLSRCMDLMDLGKGFSSYEEGVSRIPPDKQGMLLPIKQDALIPASEMIHLGGLLGHNGVQVHVEKIDSTYGHDAFLKEHDQFNPRLSAFLALDGGVHGVRNIHAEMYTRY